MNAAQNPETVPTAAPQPPSTAYLDAASQVVAGKIAAASPPESVVHYPGQEKLWSAASLAADDLRDQLGDIVADLHAHPEVAFEEVRSMNMLADVVERYGAVTTRGVYGVDTAFEAQWCSADFDPRLHPTVVIMAEYDALPEIGHACGHNVIAAAGVGAFLAVRSTLDKSAQEGNTVPGRVRLLGTPAEEGHTGKEYLIRGGALEGADVAMMVHGFGYDIASHTWVGRRSATVMFHGIAAHASSQPFMGRNALDAASLAYQAMGLQRQQMPPSDRLHAIITEGGTRPSIIPETARMDVYVRSTATRTLLDLSARVNDIVRGAALMTGCGVDIAWDEHPMSLPVRNNETMALRWAHTQRQRGRLALPAGTVPDTLAASTDFGNVSHLVPGIHPMIKVSPADVALHTQDFARWAASDKAVDAAVDSAAGLAQVAIDVLADADFRGAVCAEFAQEPAISVTELIRE